MDQDQANTLVIFQVGPYAFSVSAMEVEAIISPPPITTIPFAPKSVAGTCLFHEKVALIISLHQKFGLKRNGDIDNDQLIVTQLQSGLAAFWVDAVHDVATSTELLLEKITATQSHGVFNHFLIKDGQIILHTDFETLYNLPDGKFIDDVLQSLPHFQVNDIAEQEKFTDISSSQLGDTAQAKEDAAMVGDTEKMLHEETDAEESPADIFDFEVLPDTQRKIISTSGSIDYSIDDEDAFDTKRMHNNGNINVAMSGQTPKSITTRPVTHSRFIPDNTRESIQDPSELSPPPHRKKIIGWLSLFVLLLAFAGTLFLLPTQEGSDKAAQKKKSQRVAEKKQPARKPLQLEKESILPESTETETAVVSSPPQKDDEKMAPDTNVQSATLDTISQEESKMQSQALSETDYSTEPPARPDSGSSIRETIDKPAPSAAPETVPTHSESIDLQPVIAPEAQGEIYRVENKDFAIIVERPAKKEILLLDEKPKKKKVFQEFIHIVKKGDTLWAIARKYLGDPFLYNDLAKNSEIKNPDLIYPGDRVRIIKKRRSP